MTLEELKAALDAANSRASKAEADLAKQTARADEAEKRLTDSEKARADAADPKRLSEAIQARVRLEKRAAELAPAVKCDGLTDGEIKLAVIDARDPAFKDHARRNDAAYLDARFDLLAPGIPETTRVEDPEAARRDSVQTHEDRRAKFAAEAQNTFKRASEAAKKGN